MAFAETLAGVAATAALRGDGYVCVEQEINANHLRPAQIGVLLTGTTRPFHIGARSQVWAMCGPVRITMAVIERPERFKK